MGDPISQTWVFTLNFPHEVTHSDPDRPDSALRENFFEDLQFPDWLRPGVELPRWCTYLVYQTERGSESHTVHFQGYLETKSRCRRSTCKRQFGDERVHLEPRRGTLAQATGYCKDPAKRVPNTPDPIEKGEASHPGQGSRTDLLAVANRIREGANLFQLAEEFPRQIIQYPRGVQFYYSLHAPVRRFDGPVPHVTVLYGDPGLGKTRFCWQEADTVGLTLYPVPETKSSGIYFDGYDPRVHDAILIDDIRGSRCKFTFLLQLLDVYEFRLPVHGGLIPMNCSRFYLTSNLPPWEWYPQVYPAASWDLNPLKRRITRLLHITHEGIERVDVSNEGSFLPEEGFALFAQDDGVIRSDFFEGSSASAFLAPAGPDGNF